MIHKPIDASGYIYGRVPTYYTHYLVFPATDTHKAFYKPVHFDKHTDMGGLRRKGIHFVKGVLPDNYPQKPEPLD
jgi:hypothetical protein